MGGRRPGEPREEGGLVESLGDGSGPASIKQFKKTNTVFDVEKLKLHLRDNSTKRKPTQYVVEFNYFLKRETKTRNYICFEKLETVF